MTPLQHADGDATAAPPAPGGDDTTPPTTPQRGASACDAGECDAMTTPDAPVSSVARRTAAAAAAADDAEEDAAHDVALTARWDAFLARPELAAFCTRLPRASSAAAADAATAGTAEAPTPSPPRPPPPLHPTLGAIPALLEEMGARTPRRIPPTRAAPLRHTPPC
jgi:hypothetical protein